MNDKDYVKEFIDIIAKLRAPNGCPWDREQTHESIKSCLVEECAELLDTIDDKDDEHMEEELGDVMMQVLFHSQIATEEGRFTIQDVARTACEKLVRRHPHVFADSEVNDAGAVLKQWEEIKKTEKGNAHRKSAVSGVPRHLPALHRAQKIQKKAAKVGFDWPDVTGVIAKIEEELQEVKEAILANDQQQIAEEIGDLIFSVVNLSRFQNHYAEELLHGTVKKFGKRFRKMEELLENQELKMEECSLDELESGWQEAKKFEKEIKE